MFSFKLIGDTFRKLEQICGAYDTSPRNRYVFHSIFSIFASFFVSREAVAETAKQVTAIGGFRQIVANDHSNDSPTNEQCLIAA